MCTLKCRVDPGPGKKENARSDTARQRRKNRYCDIAILIANGVEELSSRK